MRGLLFALLFALPLVASAQVADDFADGDFTTNPIWTGDVDRFTVVPFENDFALRSDGIAESDTIALATPSAITAGQWRFRFRFEDNLTTGKGTRVYLVANTEDLEGEVQGYYVQIGTNNSDEIRLYRQDGPATDRVELGDGIPDVVTGEAGDVVVEVNRQPDGTWAVIANPDTDPVSFFANDNTYTSSTHIGVWLKHTSTSGAAFFWDDVSVSGGSSDTTPPVAEFVTVTQIDRLRVQFSEQIDGATIAPEDFVVPGIGSPFAAEPTEFDGIGLFFSNAFPAGSYMLDIDGLTDNAGNPLAPTSLPFEVENDPPVLVEAVPLSATEIEVRFDEPVANISDATLYTISPDIGQPVNTSIPLDPPASSVVLELGTPLSDGALYTVTVRGAEDALGNVQAETSASLFFGTPAVPSPGDLVVNEIMYDPPTGGSDEYVELFNRTDSTFDLGQFLLADAAGAARISDAAAFLLPGSYAVLVRDGETFTATFPGVVFTEVTGWRALNNSGDDVTLLYQPTTDDAPVEIDRVPYLPSWGGTDAALERIDPAGSSGFAVNFATSTAPSGGTPGMQNSVFAPDIAPPTLLDVEAVSSTQVLVRFDEPLTATSAETTANYSISDGVGAPTMATLAPEGDPTEVLLSFALPLGGPRTYLLVVRNVADLRGNVLLESSQPFFFGEGDTPTLGDLVVNEIMYDPPTNGSGEYVEVFNRTADLFFDLRDFSLDDASIVPTPVTTEASFVGPGEYGVIVQDREGFLAAFPDFNGDTATLVELAGWGTLNNGGDTVVLGFLDREAIAVVDSVAYNPSFGGDGVALERRDPAGPSQSRANFASSIAAAGGTPGAENSVFEPDTTGPLPVEADVSPDERTLTVLFDEPLDEASVTAEAFTLAEGGEPVGSITDVTYSPGVTPTVALTFDGRLPGGDLVLTVSGVRDLLGNETEAATLAITFTADVTPPAVTAAVVLNPTTVAVTFSELVPAQTALDAGNYSLDAGIGAPASVAYDPALVGTAVRLSFDIALTEQTLYTLTVAGLADRSGNVSGLQQLLLFFGQTDVPDPGDIVINEIMFDPLSGADGEYVELRNTTSKTFDLQQLRLTDDGDPDASPISDTPLVLPPEGLLVLASEPDSVRAVFGEVPGLFPFDGFPSLNNTEDTIVLATRSDGRTVTIDFVTYSDDWHRPELRETDGVALERIAIDGPSSDASNWSSSLNPLGGTPGLANSVFVDPEAMPLGDAGLVIDSPFAPDEGQSARIAYTLEADAAVVRVRIFDGAGRAVRMLEAGDLVGRTGFLDWDGRDDAGRQLRVGIYVVLLEALDAQGGTSEAYKDVTVLARRF